MMDSTIAESLGPDDPREIGAFSVIGLLGTGGMGEVYLGVSDKGYAAVKRVRPRLVPSERFAREVGLLYRVPAGVGPRVLASDGMAERPWFAAEYIPGLTVDEAVRLRGPLPAGALWLLLAEAAGQLQAVHEAGIAHRDVKPGNVMLVRDGVRLIDFGIARAADQARLTRSGGGYGTQGFSAPEQQAGEDDVAAPADVYGLGALLLYAASGRTPGAVPDAEPLNAVDAALSAVARSCLATAPGSRPTAGEVAAEARAHLPVPPPTWPSEVMARIASRRAFAVTPVGKLETVPPPGSAADPDAETVPEGAAAPTRTRRLPGRRLLRPAAGVVALALGGAVGAFLLIPSAASRDGAADPPRGPSATVAPATEARTSAAGPSPSAAPATRSASPTAGVPAATAGKDATDPPRPSRGSTPPARTPSAPAAARPTSSSIPGVNGNEDPAKVRGSEVDVTWLSHDAGCSAWLDDNGSGALAGVLNTSLNQSCGAELHRSDGMAYTFRSTWGAAKTNFIPDAGTTMWICVWNMSDTSYEACSPRFAMDGGTPVKD